MEKEIIEIEEAVRLAQLASDAIFFEKVLSDDFKFITPQGKIITKREDIDQYKSGQLKMTKVDVSERQIDVFLGTAISRFKVKFEGKAGNYEFSSTFLFTRVYSKIENSWKMVAGHSTEIR
jgi:hypothetical protein